MFRLLAIYISLITCTPGTELYTKYGHTAIRLIDDEQQIDWCFNYGTFSFNTSNFYWKFVKGETYYQLSVEPTQYFLETYAEENRPVYEQAIHLTQEQAIRLRNALLANCRPANREYLYNFVFDNCATRPYHLITDVVGNISSPYTGWENRTYRQFIEHYTRPHTVVNALINTVFGSRADQPMHGEERLFLPEELMFYLEDAQWEDGSPVVYRSDIQPFEIQPTRWWENIYTYLILFAVLLSLLSLYDAHAKKFHYGWDLALGILYLIFLSIVVFLCYFSIHPLVGWNIRLCVLPSIYLICRIGTYFLLRRTL